MKKENYEELFQIKETIELNELREDIKDFIEKRTKDLKIHYLSSISEFKSEVYDDVTIESMRISVRKKNK